MRKGLRGALERGQQGKLGGQSQALQSNGAIILPLVQDLKQGKVGQAGGVPTREGAQNIQLVLK
jgi:hypothetical protein